MKNKMLVNLLMISILSLSFNSCSKNDGTTSTEASLKQKILGKWKLTKSVQGVDVIDYTAYIDKETTEEYLENGTFILREWGEVSYETYELSGNYITFKTDYGKLFINKIISIDNSELVLDMMDKDETRPPRIRYFIKIN